MCVLCYYVYTYTYTVLNEENTNFIIQTTTHMNANTHLYKYIHMIKQT